MAVGRKITGVGLGLTTCGIKRREAVQRFCFLAVLYSKTS